MTKEELDVLRQRGISEQQFLAQLKSFEDGFPYLKVIKPATKEDGILVLDSEQKNNYISLWTNYTQAHDIVKFVPASGAASRMFKNLFEFRSRGGEPQTDFEKKFFDEINKFAFFDSLHKACLKNEGKSSQRLIDEKKYEVILDNLLLEKGLNYKFLPKGLLYFHNSIDGVRTPFEEHLVEGALYAKGRNGKVRLHYTVSEEHLPYFNKLKQDRVAVYEYKFGTEYDITFSVQSHSTDTVAVDLDNQPLKLNGSLVFRPGGHGALIQNLNAINADVIFIKNIDNVVPDALKQPTVEYKAVIAGVLIETQQKIFEYLRKLEAENVSQTLLDEIDDFLHQTLSIASADSELYRKNRRDYLFSKLNRPIRVCGMVKNEGEPGGGPFFAINPDGSYSLQVLESAQFDSNDKEQMAILASATHFNPVDLVCAVRDYKGNKFDLTKYVDHNTGFISSKSKDGVTLKALELPGLWNGAMSDWNTIFVEVPIDTFNPVKTVNDLLRREHQIS